MDFDIDIWIKIAAYTGAGIAMGFGAIGAAIGEGYTAAQANSAISTNVKNSGSIAKNMLVGQAVAESASIFALVVAILLLFVNVPKPSLLKAASLLAAGISMGFGAMGAGIGSGIPGGYCFLWDKEKISCHDIYRNHRAAPANSLRRRIQVQQMRVLSGGLPDLQHHQK